MIKVKSHNRSCKGKGNTRVKSHARKSKSKRKVSPHLGRTINSTEYDMDMKPVKAEKKKNKTYKGDPLAGYRLHPPKRQGR